MTDNPQTPEPQEGTLNGEPLADVPEAPEPTADTEGMGEGEEASGQE